jgi:hypothetical protein
MTWAYKPSIHYGIQADYCTWLMRLQKDDGRLQKNSYPKVLQKGRPSKKRLQWL